MRHSDLVQILPDGRVRAPLLRARDPQQVVSEEFFPPLDGLVVEAEIWSGDVVEVGEEGFGGYVVVEQGRVDGGEDGGDEWGDEWGGGVNGGAGGGCKGEEGEKVGDACGEGDEGAGGDVLHGRAGRVGQFWGGV